MGWLFAPEPPLQAPQTRFFGLAVGAFAGMMTGILGGSLVELAFKPLFAPVYGKLLMKRPLTAMEIFSDTENYAGLSASLSKDKKQLTLTFEREDVGREFKQLNS